jgi:monovalent cation:H+ antiporter-2, CPA2 family
MDLLLTVSVSLAAALVLGYVTQRLGLSPLVGYLVAGILVGPNTPGFIANHEIAAQLAEIGVVLLMFGVGLHFDLRDLLALRRVALPGALVQSAAATALGAAAAVGLGGAGTVLGGVVYGLALSVASTVVMTRLMADHDELHTPAGRLAVGWTIVEDLLTVLILVLLPAVVTPSGGSAGNLLASLGIALAKMVGLFLVLFVVASRVVPWLMKQVAATRSRELFTLTVLAIALGIAFGSSALFGASIALGAFLAGMVVGRSDFGLRAATEALPMRDAFAVLFFVSVGMLFDPRSLVETPLLVAATVAIVLVAKPVVSFLVAVVLRQPPRAALSVGLALGQIGEFSFILAALGTTLGILPARATSAIIAAAIVSIGLAPLLRRLVDPFVSLARRRPGKGGIARRAADAAAGAARAAAGSDAVPDDPRRRAVVVGYGPVGRTLARLLAENGVACTVIEMNLETVQRLRAQGIAAVYGDAGRQGTLASAGVQKAGTIILTASGMKETEEIIRMSRELNRDVRVFVRSSYLRERAALRTAGADLVFSGEGEVALAMNDAILADIGADAQTVARERGRLRAELFGDEPVPPTPLLSAETVSAAPAPRAAAGKAPGPAARPSPSRRKGTKPRRGNTRRP